MLGIVTIAAADQDKSPILRMHELPMTALATVDSLESGSLQIGDQLSNLARHMGEAATRSLALPISIADR